MNFLNESKILKTEKTPLQITYRNISNENAWKYNKTCTPQYCFWLVISFISVILNAHVQYSRATIQQKKNSANYDTKAEKPTIFVAHS